MTKGSGVNTTFLPLCHIYEELGVLHLSVQVIVQQDLATHLDFTHAFAVVVPTLSSSLKE